MTNLSIFGEEIIDAKCIDQIKNCLIDGSIGVLTADAHYGYQHPIGGAIAYPHHVSVSGVGFDIGCGNKAVRTNVKAKDINVSAVMDEIFRRISFGVGRPNNEPVDHPIIEEIANAEFQPQRAMFELARTQLGTVGSGNHFVDLFTDESGWLWIGVHFGSRGFGHKTATGFMALSQGKQFTDKVTESAMDAPPILLDAREQLGADYIYAMQTAGRYAMAGRDIVVDKVLEILGNPEVTFEVHNHHNYAWREIHSGNPYWVVRKGCTPAFPGQFGFIGANMFDCSVIVQGTNSPGAAQTLYSTVHGAGRVMSRTAASGKKKWVKQADGRKAPVTVGKGLVDFESVKQLMHNSNIVLRGAGADEAPECYKKLDDVLAYMGDTIEVSHFLFPIGVAMAGEETFDPYKD